MTKDSKLRSITLIILAGFVIAIIYHSIMRFYFHMGYPYNTFLFRSDDRFMDFFNPVRGSFDRDPYDPDRINFIGGYFPFGYFITFLFSLIKSRAIGLVLFLGGFLSYLGLYVKWYLGREPVDNKLIDRLIHFAMICILAYLPYPVFFIVDRANFDMVLFILISLSVIYYDRKKYTVSIVLLSCAIAMKGYPAFLLGLFLLDRRYKELLIACLLVPGLTLASLALFKDGLFVEFHKMVVSFQSASSIAFGGGSLVRFNSSLYTALIYLLSKINPNIATSAQFNVVYLLFMVSSYTLVIYLLAKRPYPFWARLLILVTTMILLFQTSGDYRLMMLYPPMMLFLISEHKSKADLYIVVLLGLIMVPKAYMILQNDANIGLLINPLLLIFLLVITLISFWNKGANLAELNENR